MKITKYRKLLILTGVMILAFTILFSSAAAAQEKVYRWKAVTHQMPGTPRYKTVEIFAEFVEKTSGGRLIIEPHGAGELFPTFNTLGAVRTGQINMAMMWAGFWSGNDPFFALLGNIPGSPIRNYSEEFYLLEELAPLVEGEYEKQGVKYLGAFDYGTPEILMSKDPINSLEDLKGLDIRTAGINATFYDKLGANTISLSAPEIYTALQLGTVDAAEYNDWLVNQSMSLHEVTNYVTEPCLHQGSIADKDLIVNPEAWEELPEDLKNIVLMARDMARYKSAIFNDALSVKSKYSGWIEEGDVELIRFSEADIAEAKLVAADLLKEYSEKSSATEEFIQTYKRVLGELGYYEDISILEEAGIE